MWDKSAPILSHLGEVALIGLDISGFSRFADQWIASRGDGAVDDLARLWDRAAAPQLDRLIDAGYRVAAFHGDGVVAYRPDRNSGETPALLARIEADFAEATSGLRLRTAALSGELALANVLTGQTLYSWATGAGVEAMHAALRRPTGGLAPAIHMPDFGMDDPSTAYSWSRAGAELRQLAIMFVRCPPGPWIWTDGPRLSAMVGLVAVSAAGAGGRLDAVTHDDKGVLLRCAFPHAEREAVLAGVAAGRRLLEQWSGPETLGVAICAGLVYRGPVRLGERYEMTVHGGAVNRAAKAAAATMGLVVLEPEQTWIGDELRRSGLTFTDGAWRASTGEPAPETPIRARSARAGALFGRRAEMAALERERRLALTASRLVLVEGPAGHGKSALAHAFLSAVGADAASAFGSALQYGGLRGPWPEILSTLLDRCFPDPASCRLALVSAGLAPDELEALGEFGLRNHPRGPPLPPVSPIERRDRLDRAALAAFGAVRAAREVVIVIDDAHWLGPEARRLTTLFRDRADRGLLVLCRQVGDAHDFAPDLRAPITLFDTETARAVVLDRRPDLAEREGSECEGAAATVAALAGGLPILVDQLARAWPAVGGVGAATFDGAMDRDAGAGLDHGGLLQRVLDLRLDGLAPAETQMLRLLATEAGAVEPGQFRDETLTPDDRLEDRVQRLIALGLVEAVGRGRVGIRHAAIGQAVRRRTPRLLLRRMHRSAARRLAEARTPEPSAIAAHWRDAEAPVRGAVWLARGAREAEAAGALRAAVKLYQEALDLIPPSAQTAARAAVWRARLAAAAFAAGELSLALAEAKRSLALPGRSARLIEPRRLALLVTSEVATLTADPASALVSLARLRRLGTGRSEGLRGREAAFWAYVLAVLRGRSLAKSLLDRGGAHGPLDRFYVEAARGLIHNCFAEWDLAEAALDIALRLAAPDRMTHQHEVASTLRALGLYLRGDAAGSLAGFDAIVHHGRARENRLHEAWGLYGAAQARIALGLIEQAEAGLDAAETLLKDQPDRQSRLICSGLRVAVAGRRTDPKALLAAVDANLAIARTMPVSNFGSFEGYAATPTVALEWLCRGGVGEAERAALLARARTGEALLAQYAAIFPLGRPRLSLCRSLRARVYGRPAKARAELEKGLAMAGRLAMTGEAARLERALAGL